ncbi:hypothetical protein B0J18DRAFT_143014 [Chaetomium sp. MPI-SDFR-AT-0129]|nr:hypothetical protein B0J18DRAFT_143014 [Chaetomium sp. MPI-SDFR-AT-0129]
MLTVSGTLGTKSNQSSVVPIRPCILFVGFSSLHFEPSSLRRPRRRSPKSDRKKAKENRKEHRVGEIDAPVRFHILHHVRQQHHLCPIERAINFLSPTSHRAPSRNQMGRSRETDPWNFRSVSRTHSETNDPFVSSLSFPFCHPAWTPERFILSLARMAPSEGILFPFLLFLCELVIPKIHPQHKSPSSIRMSFVFVRPKPKIQSAATGLRNPNSHSFDRGMWTMRDGGKVGKNTRGNTLLLGFPCLTSA